MPTIIANLAGSLTDILIYSAIALVVITGLVKCVFPVRGCARALRKAVHRLEVMTIKDGQNPVWWDTQFLGPKLQNAWRRFLVNAKQLDSRGINCDVQDYINDDSVIYQHGHTQLADVIPGILTSLGILGTFIGLVRGMSALDLTDATRTMTSISDMIGGMTFAFATSIAGVSCSLAFNILNRATVGSTQGAIDEFYDAFTEYVMQRPLSDNVQSICQQEDQAALLRVAVSEIGTRISDSVSEAVQRSLNPVVVSMNQFILGETQNQLAGLDQVVNHFIYNMNQAMGSQFEQLGKTLSGINQSRSVDYNTLSEALQSSAAVMQNMQDVSNAMRTTVARFENYTAELQQTHEGEVTLSQRAESLFRTAQDTLHEQRQYIGALQTGLQNLQAGMKEYAAWSGRVLEAVQKQSEGLSAEADRNARDLQTGREQFRREYAGFVQDITRGMQDTSRSFENAMKQMTALLQEQLQALRIQDGRGGSDQELIRQASLLQQTLSDMTDTLRQLSPKSGMEA